MKKRNLVTWHQSLLHQKNILTANYQIKLLIQHYITTKKDTLPRVSEVYPLIKMLGGISIEIGEVSIVSSSEEQIIDLLNDFVTIDKNGNFQVLQNITALQKWVTILQIEILNIQNSEGYICNNELVNFYEDENNVSFLQFKYRTDSGSSYIMYKLAFIIRLNKYFLFKIQLM